MDCQNQTLAEVLPEDDLEVTALQEEATGHCPYLHADEEFAEFVFNEQDEHDTDYS